ncbi:MAG: MEKHLA domain-containing protein [Nitrosomonadales bacterium]|nr:MEKHLA domain-containing protein [Nitrosomonadales bacterium]
MPYPADTPNYTPQLDARLRLLIESYARIIGGALVANAGDDISQLRLALWEAPRVILAHGTEADPVFFYGNRLALHLFEFDCADFIRLPSRYSAEPLAREARTHLLARVTQQGYVDDYSGVRIASSGKRFVIERATVWNLLDAAGQYHGQAAMFDEWTPTSVE